MAWVQMGAGAVLANALHSHNRRQGTVRPEQRRPDGHIKSRARRLPALPSDLPADRGATVAHGALRRQRALGRRQLTPAGFGRAAGWDWRNREAPGVRCLVLPASAGLYQPASKSGGERPSVLARIAGF